MIAFATASSHMEFIIGTETGIIYPLSKANPDKVFIPADSKMVCPDMKKTGLTDIVNALERLEPQVKVNEEIRNRAKGAVDRMLGIPLK
jgi:quinolinate synthase